MIKYVKYSSHVNYPTRRTNNSRYSNNQLVKKTTNAELLDYDNLTRNQKVN